jgi:hypothetical protein
MDMIHAMQLDVASFKMAYEASRDAFLQVLRPLPGEPPSGLPEAVHESYRRGYEQGFVVATSFDPNKASDLPPELEWEFESAWRLGYSDGELSGSIYREMIWNSLTKAMGFKSTLM